jgi:hypothetical protein
MQIFLAVLLIAAMAATAYVLVRGVVTMASGRVGSSEQHQQRLRTRDPSQAVAISLAILLLVVAGTAGF